MIYSYTYLDIVYYAADNGAVINFLGGLILILRKRKQGII
jgi:hypothetical protein